MSLNYSNHFIKRIECPVCTSKKLILLYEKSYEDEKIKTYLDGFYNPQGGIEHEFLKDISYTLKQCLTCDLIFQESIPNDELMFKLYEQWINPTIVFNQQVNFPLWYTENYANHIVNIISYFNTVPSKLKFLDFGMGWGRWCLMAKAFGCNVYGLELSESRANYAKKNGINILDIDDLKVHKFDFINTDQVFEHIPKPLDLLKELSQYLKPNGVIRVCVPDGNNADKVIQVMDWKAKKGMQNSLNIVAPLEHINCYSTRTIIHLAKLCNLKLVNIPLKRHYYKSKRHFVKTLIKKKLNKQAKSTNLYFIKNEA
ncbi:class I SAM-dependent methyltransferase [Aestuariivivens marinum]|uniref:class I SAM-dependent methyltransferase n=1 Tax=Aestuariivivens marinum TaxID=2913555 RepID=UPI001F59C210|nr:class I SAM-dependent methyltransferase [Aestuariivivens marinum]